MSSLQAFNDWVGGYSVESDGGWSEEVWMAAWAAATKAEREGCAELAEATPVDHTLTGYKIYGSMVAQAIRNQE